MSNKSIYPLQISLCVIAFLTLLCACTSKRENNDSTLMSAEDSVHNTVEPETAPEESGEESPEEIPPGRPNIIQYRGATDNEIKRAFEPFSLFVPVTTLADQSIRLKDSLEMIRQTQSLTNPEDSLVFAPVENAAYQAILDYKKLLAAGKPLDNPCPGLLDLTRIPEATDSSLHFLPKTAPSDFLSHGKFFFLGGAPFIAKLQPEENTTFTDRQGKPEVRFLTSITENANYLLRSIYHFKNGPIDIEYGPPLESYETGPREVRGIGSLTHQFSQRIPAFFLTEEGLVPAHLISIKLKLVPEYLGCNSDQPYIQFACSKNINDIDILGVYIPYGSPPPTSSMITRPSDFVWTADLNNDGVADLACVTSLFAGAISDTMTECLWFINIDGTWKIIDWAAELDCT